MYYSYCMGHFYSLKFSIHTWLMLDQLILAAQLRVNFIPSVVHVCRLDDGKLHITTNLNIYQSAVNKSVTQKREKFIAS